MTRPAPLLAVFVLVFAQFVRLAAATDPPLDSLVLLDVQGLWGGQNLWLQSNGTAIVQFVTEPKKGQMGLQERRYHVRFGDSQPSPARLGNLKHLPGIPGGPRATVSYPFSVPGGSYFVLADNTTNAYDSRFWGALPAQSIRGRVSGK